MTSLTPLTAPGQIVANLPGILGFFPHDSIIIASFTSVGADRRFRLGPVMRIDVDDLHLLPELADALEPEEEDLLFAFLVTARSAAEVDEVADELADLADADILPVSACWWTREILTGEPLQLLFGPRSAADDGWRDGVVAPVSQAQAMSTLLSHGQLPDLSREETIAQFDHGNPAFTLWECGQLTGFALRYSRELLSRMARGGSTPWGSYGGVALDLRLLLEEIAEEERGAGSLMEDDEAILTAATLLGNSTLRDLILEEAVVQPQAASRLMLAVARTCTGTIRHNALSLYALCAVATGLTMRAMPALIAVLEEDAGHRLAGLLLDACQAGAFDTLMHAVREGSRMVRAEHGVEEPSSGGCSGLGDFSEAA